MIHKHNTPLERTTGQITYVAARYTFQNEAGETIPYVVIEAIKDDRKIRLKPCAGQTASALDLFF